MKAMMARLRRAWFGCQPKETVHHLRKLLAIQESEAAELELAVQKERSIAVQLGKKMEEKAALLESASEKAGAPPQELLAKRMERSLEALRKQGNAEAESLRSMLETRRAQHDRHLQELDKQLTEYKEALDNIMRETSQWIAKIQLLPIEVQPILSDKEMEEVLQATTLTNEAKMEFNIELSDDAVKKENASSDKLQSAKIIQFRMRSLLSKMEKKVMEAGQIQITSDGMHPPELGSTESIGSLYDFVTEDAAAETASASAIPAASGFIQQAASVYQPKLSVSPLGFWGDLEPYLRIVEPSALMGTFEQTVDRSPSQSSDKQERQSVLGAEFIQEPAAPEDHVPSTTTAAELSPEPSSGSPALAEEIKAVQHRYIVGKEAGENLYGENGVLIVAKGKLITMDVVQAAERAGKLSDLIVNMVIPGFGAVE